MLGRRLKGVDGDCGRGFVRGRGSGGLERMGGRSWWMGIMKMLGDLLV